MTENVASTWLTQDAAARLRDELDNLILNRSVVASEVNARREEGDLSDNGGYQAAREEQSKQEMRIRQLQELLNRAQIGVRPPDDGVVEPGMAVTVAYDDDEEDQETFLLGSREEGVFCPIPVYSLESPLGAAILGARPGDSRDVQLPSRKTQRVTIKASVPFDSLSTIGD